MTAEVPATITQDVEQVLTRISDAFVILDCEWRYTYVNDKLAELAGMNKEDFLGKSIWEFPDTVDSRLYTELHRAVVEQVTVNFGQVVNLFGFQNPPKTRLFLQPPSDFRFGWGIKS